MKRILIVDDERGSRESLRTVFNDRYDVHTAESAAQASTILSKHKIDLLLLDVLMPEKDGVEFLNEAQEMYPGLPVIMVSASTSVRPIVESIQIGAYDFVTKPFDVAEIRRLAERAIDGNSLNRHVETLRDQIAEEFPIHGIIGQSSSFIDALSDARKVAQTEAHVLITGESGTGKELVARLIHAFSTRVNEPFVPVHCGALPESLMETELFGHEKGAFTSADRQKQGRFDLAGSGTLFFDEIGEMSLATQVKLLRVIQEKEFMRVGGTRVLRTDARIVTATNTNLREAVIKKTFREDLFYRLSVVPITLPPLRQRKEDIPSLAQYFLRHFKSTRRYETRGFHELAMERMNDYDWPGNVRELRNVVERMLVLHGKSPFIREEHLPEEFQARMGRPARLIATTEEISLTDAVNEFERHLVESALEQANGVQTRAAAILGTTRRILKYRMEKLNISA